MSKLARAGLTAALLLGVAQAAHAATITGSVQGYGGGILFTLSATDEVVPYGDVTVTLRATVTGDPILDNGDLSSIDPAWINMVDVGIHGMDSFMLLDAPNQPDADGAVWTSVFGPASNRGCQGRSGVFACAATTDPDLFAAINDGAVHEWVWGVELGLPTEDFFANGLASLSHIGAQVQREGHLNGWILSETPIPEPGTALLFGLGMIVTGWSVRRRA